MWIRLTVHLLHGRVRYCFTIRWFSGQSKSLLRFRSMPGEAVNGSEGAIERCEGQVEEFNMSPSYQELLGIDGEAIEFPRIFDIPDTSENPVWFASKKHWTWKIHRSDHLHVIQRHRLDKERKWWNLFEFTESQGLREEILARTLDVGLGEEKKWYGTLPYTPEGKDTGHPVFKSISALSRGILEKKNGQDTTHFNADASNTELLFQIIHSVNQHSIYGAVTNWCEQFGLTEKEKGQAKLKESVTKDVFNMCEITRSKTCGISSKTSIWKQLTRKHVQT